MIVLIIEVGLYIEKEHIKTDIYALREEIIELKLENRALTIEYAKRTNVENLYAWAVAHGYTDRWMKFSAEEE